MHLDHIAISGETRAEAQAFVEDALGVALQIGGAHAVFHTHNALLGLEDGLYLEAIAINPDAPTPDRPRWFDLDRFSGSPRVTNWICATSDLDGTVLQSPHDFGAPVALQRDALQWRMAVPSTGILPFDGMAPALIQWDSGVHPANSLMQMGVRLRHMTVSHPKAEQLRSALPDLETDARISFESGDAGFSVVFETPHGERVLTS